MTSELRIGKFIVDPVLFAKGFAKSHGPFACETSCCASGVFADIKERDVILGHKEAIKPYMDETQTKVDAHWFDTEVNDDPDFVSGKTVGTQTHNDKCVFRRSDGRCSVQVYGDESGAGAWTYKPFYCIAFPIVVCDGVLTFDDYQQGITRCCSIVDEHAAPLIDSCKDELEYILGKEGYGELLLLRDRYVAEGTK
jgi:hypothetical protein